MNKAIIAVLCLLGSCSAVDISNYYINLDVEQRELIETRIHECYAIAGINDAIYNQAVQCGDMSDPKMETFLYCYLRKFEFVTDENEFDISTVKDIMTPINFRAVEMCRKVVKKGSKIYAKEAAIYMECYFKNSVPGYCKAKPRKTGYYH